MQILCISLESFDMFGNTAIGVFLIRIRVQLLNEIYRRLGSAHSHLDGLW